MSFDPIAPALRQGGSAFPVVEISTPANGNAQFLTAEEAEVVSAAVETGMPFVAKISSIDTTGVGGTLFATAKMSIPGYPTKICIANVASVAVMLTFTPDAGIPDGGYWMMGLA